MTWRLSADEIDRFEREGWIGPYPAADAAEARALAPELLRANAQTRGQFYPPDVREGDCFYADGNWFQSLHCLSPAVCEIGLRPAIVERVAQLIGEDVMLWGGICFAQEPDEHLHWHTDTEYDYWGGVSVWMGAENVGPENALKILPGSHRFPRSPEFYQQERGLSMDDLVSDETVMEMMRDWNPASRFIRAPVSEGEFILFNGKLWHASDNPGRRRRIAMGLRYSTPDQRIRIPLTYLHPVIFDPTPAPCIMARGEDHHGANRIEQPPT